MKLEGKLLSICICYNVDIWMGKIHKCWHRKGHVTVSGMSCAISSNMIGPFNPTQCLITVQTNQPMRYAYLTPCRLQSGFPHSARHLDWQMPSKQDSHSQQTSAGSHTLQKGRSIIHLVDLAPEPEYAIYQTALMYEQSTSPWKKASQDDRQSCPSHRTHFSRYQAPPALLGW